MEEQSQSKRHGYGDDHQRVEQVRIDLTLLFTTDLHVGSKSLYQQKLTGSSLSLLYELDGDMHSRAYQTPVLWRAIMLLALSEGTDLTIHEMDQPGRYRRLFPKTLLSRLQWHARPNANFPPVARLYDPNGKSEMLLTRSRCCRHAVDALHNLTDGGPVFQSIWLSDIIALRPLLGTALVRDETFSATMPISAYLEAAAMTGRIVQEPELTSMPLTGRVVPLAVPPLSRAVAAIFEQECRRNPALAKLHGRSIYGDYRFAQDQTFALNSDHHCHLSSFRILS